MKRLLSGISEALVVFEGSGLEVVLSRAVALGVVALVAL